MIRRMDEMKKLVALVLALALVLTIAGSMAASPSPSGTSDIENSAVVPTTNDTSKETTTDTTSNTTNNTTSNNTDYSVKTEPEITSEILKTPSKETEELKAAFAEALAKGDVLSVFPANILNQIPAGYKTINEVVTVKLSGSVSKVYSLTVNYKLVTLYPVGEKVIVAYAVVTNGNAQWYLVEGVAQADGSINVTLNKTLLDAIANKNVTMAVISK